MGVSLSGNLEDISIIDVLQILSLASKSGVLHIQRPQSKAEIGFSQGRITSASIQPHLCFMTDLMIEHGQVSQELVDRAVALQQQISEPRTIGGILLEMNAVTLAQIEEALRIYIQRIIGEIARWTDGDFSFEQGETRAFDGLGFLPGNVTLKLDLNPQELLLEALRIQDEATQELEDGAEEAFADPTFTAEPKVEAPAEPAPPPAEPAPEPVGEAGVDVDLAFTESEQPIRRHPLLLLSSDVFVRQVLKQRLVDLPLAFNTPSTTKEALELQTALASQVPVLVVDLDLDPESLAVEDAGMNAVVRLRQRWPSAPLITFGRNSSPGTLAALLGAEITFHVPRPSAPLKEDMEAHRQFTETLALAIEQHQDVEETSPAKESEKPAWVDPLHNLYITALDLRRNYHSVTVSLDLMRFIAQHIERAILFLVTERELIGLGLFGVLSKKAPELSRNVSRLRLPIRPDSAVHRVIHSKTGEHLLKPGQDPMLGELFEVIGLPVRAEALLMPLIISDRTISMIYGDNGSNTEPLPTLDLLGVLAEHAGLLLENLLLRRSINRGQQPSQEMEGIG